MILLHLFYSVVPRALDTPRMRVIARAACVALFALVLATAVSRGEETTPPAEPTPAPESQPAAPHQGRGNVSIIHVQEEAANDDAHASAAQEHPVPPPAAETPAASVPQASAVAETPHAAAATESSTETETAPPPESAAPSVAAHPPGHDAAEAPAHGETPAPAAPVKELVHEATPKVEAAHAPEGTPAAESHVPATAHGHAPASVAATPAPAHVVTGVPEVDDAAESGRRFWQAGDYAAAEKAFTRALTANAPVEAKRALVLEMAALYRGADQLTKAAAVLEKFVKTFPNDREVPQVLLRLGAIYRDLGVYSMATARFFQVLNSTLRVSDEDIPEYRKLAMKARLEIAETYAVQGNLTEAEKYFSRLQLLELDPEDRERVLLRAAQMQYTLKQWLAAEKALAAFAASSPESPNLAEVRYMRAKALDELGRKQEAVDEVVALLQIPVPGDPEVARTTSYWKRRCANELANRFYEQGDFLGALSVYQALARASMDPSWRWPAIYQIGLCFERMDMPLRAAEAYDAILSPETAPAAGTKLPESLVSLQDMARWRRSHLVWIDGKGKQLESLAADKPAS